MRAGDVIIYPRRSLVDAEIKTLLAAFNVMGDLWQTAWPCELVVSVYTPTGVLR